MGKPHRPKAPAGLAERFHEGVDRLLGPIDSELGRTGGLYDEIVQPRPGVLRHDLSAEDRAIVRITGRRVNGLVKGDRAAALVAFVDRDDSKPITDQNYGRISRYGVALSVDKIFTIGGLRNGGSVVIHGKNDPRRGQVVEAHFKGDSETKPFGVSKRLDRERGSFCLVTGYEVSGNDLIVEEINEMLTDVANGHYLEGKPKLAFFTEVEYRITFRSDDSSYANYSIASNRMNKEVKIATAAGSWAIHDIPGMACDVVGEVGVGDRAEHGAEA